MSTEPCAIRIRQGFGDHDAARMALEPFMPLDHYFRHFDFQLCAQWPEPDYSRETWGIHYGLFQIYKHDFGFFQPSSEWMDRLVSILRLEIGVNGRVLDAGSGFMSNKLCRPGVDAFAVDRCDYENKARQSDDPLVKVYQRDALGDAVNHVSKPFGAVLLIWPPYDRSFAFDISNSMHPGQLLIFEGEDAGGCTGDDKFFEYVSDADQWLALKKLSDRLDAVHLTFAAQHDHWSIWRKVSQ